MANKTGVVAIIGQANVGKSSLFNALVGRRDAIVAKEAGTTRDSISAKASYKNTDFWLVDTAGMKPAEDEFELTIQEQIAEASESADLILVVVDAGSQITEEDRRIAKSALKTRKPVILVVSKADTNKRLNNEEWRALGVKDIVATSATQKSGLEELLEDLVLLLPKSRIKVADNRIKLAFVGRPNVGKSSLFNKLGVKQQAVVSERAGTTRDVNRLVIKYHEREIELMDTAGIRRSGKIERGVEQFSVLRALSAIEEADISVVLIDSTELNTALDQKIAGMVKDSYKGLILVVSKWDKAADIELEKQTVAQQVSSDFAFVPWAPLVFTSSETGENATKIFELALEIAENRISKFKTSELNNWLQKTVRTHEPAGLHGQMPKLNYMVQEDDMDYPSFKVFGAHTKALHWSYKRYMERSFRENWPLAGTPLKFWFIEKN